MGGQCHLEALTLTQSHSNALTEWVGGTNNQTQTEVHKRSRATCIRKCILHNLLGKVEIEIKGPGNHHVLIFIQQRSAHQETRIEANSFYCNCCISTKQTQFFLGGFSNHLNFFRSAVSVLFLGNINYLNFFRSHSILLIYIFNAQNAIISKRLNGSSNSLRGNSNGLKQII